MVNITYRSDLLGKSGKYNIPIRSAGEKGVNIAYVSDLLGERGKYMYNLQIRSAGEK